MGGEFILACHVDVITKVRRKTDNLSNVYVLPIANLHFLALLFRKVGNIYLP